MEQAEGEKRAKPDADRTEMEVKSRHGTPLWTMSGRVRASESTFDQCLSSGDMTDERHRCTSSFLGRLLV